MKCSRRMRHLKIGLLVFGAGVLLIMTAQLHQYNSNSSARVIKKTSLPNNGEPAGVHVALPVGVEDGHSKIVNNGRSPKQVVEAIKTRPSSKEKEEEEQQIINRTLAVETATVSPIDPLPSLTGPNSLDLLKQLIVKINKAQAIYNEDKFPPLQEDGLVLVVQVHKREGYLKQLLESLKAAKGVEKILLVISHDYYYDDMNKLIQSIDFCQVMQIFYPFSLQVMPTSFPGASPNDCPRDASKTRAMKSRCTNAEHPDTYGHYREAIVTAIKHHWWWKINMVFDNLVVTQNYSGHVLFLEEDHYVASDFIHVARQLIALKQQCSDCDFINLGMYNKANALNSRASVGIWNAGKNNMGFGMDRNTWNLIRNCSKHFCTYDDYNWDWSINQLGKACPLFGRDLKVLVMRSPRVFHIGTCGTHHHKSCNEAEQANRVRALLTRESTHLFPEQLSLEHGIYPGATRRKPKPYGGWGDIRDHELCMHFIQGSLLDGKLPT